MMNNTAVETLPYTYIHLSHILFHHFHRKHSHKSFHNRPPYPSGDLPNRQQQLQSPNFAALGQAKRR